MCLLPEHLHCLWTLPGSDSNYSLRWAAIKAFFSKQFLREGGHADICSSSRLSKGEVAIWQRRYWEHCIRDDADFERHFDYIHYNPVHHHLVENVHEWPWSSFHKYRVKGFYSEDWGAKDIGTLALNGEFGE